MDRARSKLAGTSKLANFFETDEDESFPPKSVAESKLSSYQAGQHWKSKRDREKEAAEAKKREEEEANARALAEYMETFEGQDHGKQKTAGFVRSSTESSSAYQPSPSFRTFDAPRGPRFRAPSPPALMGAKPKGKRAMDAFLEEIKRDQADREARFSKQAQGQGKSVTALAAYQGQSGSKDRGDPLTSNVFVANLPTHVTEESLGNFFSRVGSVGSVKIMWPRGDSIAGPGADMTASRKSKNTGFSGFVSFMRRKDAEAALRDFDGYEWGGSVLRVGWSKAVPIAAKAKYPSNKRSLSHGRSRSRSPEHYGGRDSRSRSRSPGQRRSYSRGRDDERRHRRSRSPRLEEDEDTVTDTFIRAVAGEIRSHDADYEAKLRQKEWRNPKYAFLIEKDHRRHAFYRGLLESSRQLEPEFDDEGYNSVYSTDSGEESERERVRRNVLGKLARRRFEAMLRALAGQRGEIARCMAFSLEHAEAAHEVADIIVASLLVDGTAVPRKVARLHLICDILHNSAASVPSAWKFRQEFQSRLGIVFDHLRGIYHSFPGRITAETFKKQIISVVEIWEDWIVFPPDFTAELRARLEGQGTQDLQTSASDSALDRTPDAESTQTAASKFKSGGFKLATAPADSRPAQAVAVSSGEAHPTSDDVDGAPIDDLDGAPMDDLDGAPMDDLDGAPMDDLDGAPMDGLDGTPLDENDSGLKNRTVDIDGEPVYIDDQPMEEDIDGEPVLG